MLTELRVKNLAIIESVTLPLGAGFNVLSGETGAGKSIIVGALGLLLGDRASADDVRTGADKASVEGTFDIADRPELQALLDARGIEVDDGRGVLKRQVATRGRGAGWLPRRRRRSHHSLPASMRERADLAARRADAERRADYLRHVAGEIEAASLV